jgi:hypothetical protein
MAAILHMGILLIIPAGKKMRLLFEAASFWSGRYSGVVVRNQGYLMEMG